MSWAAVSLTFVDRLLDQVQTFFQHARTWEVMGERP